MGGLSELRERHPWPDERPAVKAEPKYGWCTSDTQHMLRRFIGPQTRLVLELGSWLGLSARLILSWMPDGHLICVDHWKGSAEHRRRPDSRRFMKNDLLWLTFIHNMWKYRERLTPVRATTLDGMREIHALGLCPEVIYVDASHDIESVFADASLAHELFPKAVIVGDDFCWTSVAAGARRFADANGLRIVTSGVVKPTGWTVERIQE